MRSASGDTATVAEIRQCDDVVAAITAAVVLLEEMIDLKNC